jgi:hypothetical protein
VLRLAADPVQGFWHGKACGFKEDTGKFGVDVLAGVQETGTFAHYPHNWHKLNNFRARAEDGDVRKVSAADTVSHEQKNFTRPDQIAPRSIALAIQGMTSSSIC